MEKNSIMILIASFLISSLAYSAPTSNGTASEPKVFLTRNAPSLEKSCYPLAVSIPVELVSLALAALFHKYSKADTQLGAATPSKSIAVGFFAGAATLFYTVTVQQFTDCMMSYEFNKEVHIVNTGDN